MASWTIATELDIVKMLAMIGDVTSDTTDPVSRDTDRYHHGDLPNALRRAAVDVIAERGLGAFSLREVARRAGVSHTAPAHHFGDVRGLLTAVATEGFEALHDATAAAAARHDDPVDQLAAIGVAYVELARSNPSHCDVMFRTDVVDTDDPGLLAAGMRAYAVLEATVRALLETDHLDEDLLRATWMCWSTMQGLVVLGPKLSLIGEMKDGRSDSTEVLVRHFTDIIVGGLRSTTPGSSSSSSFLPGNE